MMMIFSQLMTIRTWGSTCSDCGSNKLVTDPFTGEVTCQECGAVVIERGVDTGPEWRRPEYPSSRRSDPLLVAK